MSESKRVLSNFIWKILERFGAQGVTLIVSIILARMLDPSVYGTIALITVFTSILSVFIDSGLGTALIQKKDADDLDFSSVFWFNIFMCLFLYCLMFFAAPAVAIFYNNPDLILVIRILSLVLILSGIRNIQQAYISKQMMFKKFFFSTLGGTLVAAVVGITMAYKGYGIWALVSQYLFNSLIDTVILWITVDWHPKFIFSYNRFKKLFAYGWKMLLSSCIDTSYRQLRSLIIGKFYSSSELAYYTKGDQLPKLAVDNIDSSMNSVLLPMLSEKQNDIKAVKSATRRVIRLSSFFIWPMMVGLCVIADKLVLVLYTDKWSPAILYLRILCFSQVLQPLQTTNLNVIKALGRSDLFLKLEIIKKTIAISIVIVSAFSGVKLIAIGSAIYTIIASILNSYPNKKLINYSYIEQLLDILPYILMSAVMAIIVYCVGLISIPIGLSLVLQIVAGILIYLLLSVIMNKDEMASFIKAATGIVHKEP